MQPLSSVLFSLHKGSPDHGQWVLACLEGAWNRILGGKLAAACRPVRFEGGDLLIKINGCEWEGAFRHIKAELLAKLRDATANEVKSISFSCKQDWDGI